MKLELIDNFIDKKSAKISFIGDIMCELPLLKASCTKGKYQFDRVFAETIDLFSSADYVVGNLETVFAGEKAKYTKSLYSFNTPDAFLDSLKKSGIGMCITSNNHCLDRGIEGLKRTLYELDKREIQHIGTYLSREARNQIFIKNINGLRIAFIAYTYGTGIKDNHEKLSEGLEYSVNLLIPQGIGSPIKYSEKTDNLLTVKRFISGLLPEKRKLQMKKILGKTVGVPRVDSIWDDLIDKNLLRTLKCDIEEAKKQADFVIMNIHNGGQFNPIPGDFSEYIMKFCVNAGVDLVVGHHPHVVQKADFINHVLCAFSLGNYSISPSTPYMLFEDLPHYSVALHLYLNASNDISVMYSFSILKIIEDRKGSLTVYDTYDIFQKLGGSDRDQLLKDIKKIYHRFTQKDINNFNVQKEYSLCEE